MSKYTIALIGDSIETYKKIAAESLRASDLSGWKKYVQRVGEENLRGIFVGSELVGGMAFYRMGQWFGGRELACAGFSGVAVSPTDRGTGACAQMLTQLLQQLRGENVPLASLYASTQYLYRSVGFEQAGTQTQYSVPIHTMRCSDRELPVHRFETPDLDALDHAADVRAAAGNGNLGRTWGLWQRLIVPYGGRTTTSYLIGDVDKPDGYAIFLNGGRDDGHPQPLVSTDVAANTPAALRRLITLVHDHRSMCDSFQWCGAPDDPIHFLSTEQSVSVTSLIRWMLRIVDLPSALQQRGYPSNVQGQIDFEITDATLPDNSGRWRLQLDNGTATVDRGGEGTLVMDIRALAPLYSSFYSAQQLVQLGALQSSCDQQTELATQIFAGPPPWVPELF